MSKHDKTLKRLITLVRYTSGAAHYIKKLRAALGDQEKKIEGQRAEIQANQSEISQLKYDLEKARRLNQLIVTKGMEIEGYGYQGDFGYGDIGIKYRGMEPFHQDDLRRRVEHKIDARSMSGRFREVQSELLRCIRDSIAGHILKGFFEATGDHENAQKADQRNDEFKNRGW